MALSAVGLLEFDPLPTLQEDEELVTLSDVLQLREACLFEAEIWAVCMETCKALDSIQKTSMELFTTLCIAPETLAFNTTGNVCFIDSIEVVPDQRYFPPEFKKFGNSLKGHLYSLGNTLWSAIEYNLPDTLELEISDELNDLITCMCLDLIRDRPTLNEVLRICDEQLHGQDAQHICYKLSSIGLRILSIESLDNVHFSENDVELNGDINEDFINANFNGVDDIEEYLTERGNVIEHRMDNRRPERLSRTHTQCVRDEDTEKTDGEQASSGNTLAAFDQLSKRAQEILNKLYTPKNVNGNLSEESSPRSQTSSDNDNSSENKTRTKTTSKIDSEDGKNISSKIPVPKRYSIDKPKQSETYLSQKDQYLSPTEDTMGFVPISLNEGEMSNALGTDEKLDKELHFKSTHKDLSKSVKCVLEVRNGPLNEEELWALCRECAITLEKSSGVLPSYISLTSTIIRDCGIVSFQSISGSSSLESMFLAPELQDQGILNEKSCLFGVAAMLWAAADWNLPATEQPDISEELESLFVRMTQDDPDDRPDIDYVLKVCDEHEDETGVQSLEVCLELWKETIHLQTCGPSLEFPEKSLPRFLPSNMSEMSLESNSSSFVAINVEKPEPKRRTPETFVNYVSPLKPGQGYQNLGSPERPSAFKSPLLPRKGFVEVKDSSFMRIDSATDSSVSPSSSKGTLSPMQGPIPSKRNNNVGENVDDDKKINSIVDFTNSQSLILNRRTRLPEFNVPNAFSSQNTHFAPIILHEENSNTAAETELSRRKVSNSPDKFKQKMVKAMRMELIRSRPPASLVSDLEKDAADHSREKGSKDRSGKKKSRSRSQSPKHHSKSGVRDSSHDRNGRKERSKRKKDDSGKHREKREHKKAEKIPENDNAEHSTLSNVAESGHTDPPPLQNECQATIQKTITNPQHDLPTQTVQPGENLPKQVPQIATIPPQVVPQHSPNFQQSSPAQIPGQMTNSPAQNTPQYPMPGMFQNFPFQVTLQQDPISGLFHIVPVGIPFPGFQPNPNQQYPGMQQIAGMQPFQPTGLQFNPMLGQFAVSSSVSSPTDSQGSQRLKNLQQNTVGQTSKSHANTSKLTPTSDTDSDNELKSSGKFDMKNQEYSRKKKDRTQTKKQHRKTKSTGHIASDSESSEPSPRQKHDKLRHDEKELSISDKDSPRSEKSGDKERTRKRVEHRTHRLHSRRDILEELDDTKPLESTKAEPISPSSPTSMSSLSRDSGVHMQASLSSAEEITSVNDQHLMDVLSSNSVLKKVIKRIREAFAFDGYLENGVEDLAMAEYITSLANLKWTTFSSAVSEKFCDLYWEDELLEKLYEAVNQRRPIRIPKRPHSPRPTTLTKTVTEHISDNTASVTATSSPRDVNKDEDADDDDDDVDFDTDSNDGDIDDLLCGCDYEPSVSPTPSTCSAVMKSKVVADAKLFSRERERRLSEKAKVPVAKETEEDNQDSGDDVVKSSSAIENLSDLIKSLSTESDGKSEPSSQESSPRDAPQNRKSENPPLTRQRVVDSDINYAEQALNDSMKSDDLNKSTISLNSTSSGPRFIRVRSVSDHSDGSDLEEPNVPEVSERRFRKSPLANPTTIRRSSSCGDSDSSTGSKKGRIRRAFSRTISRHNSAASSSASSGMSRPGSRGAANADESSSSLPSSSIDRAIEMAKSRPNSAVFFETEAVDPLIVDYTCQLGESGDKQQSIEAKIAEVEQQLMMEYRMKAKSEKFYNKLVESHKGKEPGNDQKNMVGKVGKQISEMNKKIDFLDSAKRHLEMLYAEQWGLDHVLLHSFATCTCNQPMQLLPSDDNPLLVFHSTKEGRMLQAGTPSGLFSFLFARQALLEGYLHHFFYTYNYFATAKDLFKFITDKFLSALSVSVEQQDNRMKVHCRSIDILQVWIEGFYQVDFRPDIELTQKLVSFIKYKVVPVDPQGEFLLQLLEKHQNEVEEKTDGVFVFDDSSVGDVDKTLKGAERTPPKKNCSGLAKESTVYLQEGTQ
uniref:Uncharacterized protein LOC100378671 n=1 Tax=Saccoglossus kowalevskii TaxID=10224 RepID=A0ABM0MCT7_SACKO|nr:PREDICTED: uncharacterized protein LOC100378671 [Saccoglossus kowalevskii]